MGLKAQIGRLPLQDHPFLELALLEGEERVEAVDLDKFLRSLSLNRDDLLLSLLG